MVSLRGNHDAASQITRELRLPDNVRELPTKQGRQTCLRRARHRGTRPGVRIARGARRHRRALSRSRSLALFNIGLLHTSLTGRPGHAPYAPTTLEVLRSKGYDYWALGHVHAREVRLHRSARGVSRATCRVATRARQAPKGAMLLTLQDGRLSEVRREPLDVVRWCVCEVDASAAADAHDVVELVRFRLSEHALLANGRLLAARVVLRGATRAHTALTREPERWLAQFQACALDVNEGTVWLEQVQVRTRGALDAQLLSERDDALGQLVASLDATMADEAALRDLCAVLAELKLPRDAADGDAGVRLDDPTFVAELLPDVRELLLARLLEGDGV